jgi:NlpE N-terminal domain
MRVSREIVCIAFLSVIALAATGQSTSAPQNSSDHSNSRQTKLADAIKTMSPIGSWRGMTPCADCSGIDTTLTLYGKNPNAEEGAYKMDMTYIGRNTTNSIYGRWVLLRGSPSNDNGYIYRLDPNRAGGQFYIHADDGSLQLLDGHLNVATIAGQGITLKAATP